MECGKSSFMDKVYKNFFAASPGLKTVTKSQPKLSTLKAAVEQQLMIKPEGVISCVAFI